MKEVESQSFWVDKIVTCFKCNRSYKIEAGDEILPAVKGSSHRRGSFDYPVRFNLPCDHYIALENIKIEFIPTPYC